MKKARIINFSVFAVLITTLVVSVCIQWKNQGCYEESIWAAIGYYGGIGFALWFLVDTTIKERYKK